ncbi:hypothetical protein PR048_009504 [Dryococelus australis]|uniref:Uncharacterized protein n=1 Tax=Dryococelus australis TaxID=614101 RepID=A0ABQ9I070_9NEOP|nr:hypothetical protein PR048_009504 [Dryococelus australis]
MGRAYLRAATMESAINEFRRGDVSPFDPLAFVEQDFLPDNNDNGSTLTRRCENAAKEQVGTSHYTLIDEASEGIAESQETNETMKGNNKVTITPTNAQFLTYQGLLEEI